MGYYINYMNSYRSNYNNNNNKQLKHSERSVFRFNHININHVTRNGNNKPLWKRFLLRCLCTTPVNDNLNLYDTNHRSQSYMVTSHTIHRSESIDSHVVSINNVASNTSWTHNSRNDSLHQQHILLQSRALYIILHNNDLLSYIISYCEWNEIIALKCVSRYLYNYCEFNKHSVFQHIHTLNLTYRYGNIQQLIQYTPVQAHHRIGRAALLLSIYKQQCPSTITAIDLSMSDYSEWDTDVLLSYKHVTSLNLSGNPVTDYTIFRLCSTNYVSHITTLDLSHTRITQICMSVIASMVQLQSLSLTAQVNLNSGCSKQVGELINLHTLKLTGMALSDTDMLHLQLLTKLQSLSLMGLQTQRIPFTGACFQLLIPQYKQLHELTIINSELNDVGLSYICDNATKLTNLNISASYRITDIGCNILANSIITNQLELLDISYCMGLSETGLGYIPHLSNLRTLSIRNCCFSNISIVELFYNLHTKNIQLTELDVSGWHQLISPDHRIDSESMHELIHNNLLPSLHTLRILGCNRISDQCIVNDISKYSTLQQLYIDEHTLKRTQYQQIQSIRKSMNIAPLTIIATPV